MSARAAAPASGHASIAAVGRQLAATVISLRATMAQLSEMEIDAAASATVLGLLEHAGRSIAYGQLLAVHQADTSEIHRLDADTAALIDQLTSHPESLSDGTAHVPLERLAQGMAPHRNTQAYLQSHLHISSLEARRRLTGARLLIAPAPPADEYLVPGPGAAEPSYPVLAGAMADGSTDVATMAQLAGRLESIAPRITPRPDAHDLTTAIEESLVHEARTGNAKTCNKALQDWTEFLSEDGSAITDAEIMAKRGMFYLGFRDGCDEYLLRCDPVDFEALRSFGEAWSNPRSRKSPPRSASTGGSTIVAGGTTASGIASPTGTGASSDAEASSGDPTEQTSIREPAEHGSSRPADSPSINAPAANTSPAPTDSGNCFTPGVFGDPISQIPEWARGPEPPTQPTDLAAADPPSADPPTDHPGNPENPSNPGNPELTQRDTGPAGSCGTNDGRTGPQILLDAVIGACAGVLNGTDLSQSGGMRAHVGVLIDYRSLLGQLEMAGLTEHGRTISAQKIRAMACNGTLLPVVLGSKGEVLDMGRAVRGFTPAQRKAIAIRDRGCVVPGCQRPASTNEAHHVFPWQDGGPTSVENSASVCNYHHVMVHAGLITLRMIDGIPYVTDRAGEPRGDPERNLFWHPELRTAGYTTPLFT